MTILISLFCSSSGDGAFAVFFIYFLTLITATRRLLRIIRWYSTCDNFLCLFPALQAEKNKSHSGSPARDEISVEGGDDGGDGTGGEDEGAGTDLEHDPNETIEDYEAALDTET